MRSIAIVTALIGLGLALVSVALYVFYRLLQQFKTTWAKVLFVITLLVLFALPTLFALGY